MVGTCCGRGAWLGGGVVGNVIFKVGREYAKHVTLRIGGARHGLYLALLVLYFTRSFLNTNSVQLVHRRIL